MEAAAAVCWEGLSCIVAAGILLWLMHVFASAFVRRLRWLRCRRGLCCGPLHAGVLVAVSCPRRLLVCGVWVGRALVGSVAAGSVLGCVCGRAGVE